MDPVSQGVLGAIAAQAPARREQLGLAGLLGGLSGMAPDLDVFLHSSSDPLLFLEYHRQFTHALVSVPFGALLCAAVSYPFVRRRASFGQAYLFCLLGFATHGLLDSCTSYGTQLLWPFSDLRVAWNNVAIVDPLFTLPLVVLSLASIRTRSAAFARIACAWAIFYLFVGVAQRERAVSLGREVASERGHTPAMLEAKPAFGSLLLWKTIYEAGGRYYVDAARLGVQPHSFPGESVPTLVLERDLPWLDATSQQARDIERFRWFSAGFLALDPQRPAHVIDVRYSMVPNRIDALWGIGLDAAASHDAHATFFSARASSPDQRARVRAMLFDPSEVQRSGRDGL